MLDRLLQELDQRMVLALLVAIPCLTITASYLYLFKKPIARYAQSAETLQRLEQEAENGPTTKRRYFAVATGHRAPESPPERQQSGPRHQ